MNWKIKMSPLLLVVLFPFPFKSILAASFDCKSSRLNSLEQLICSEERLSNLDKSLSRVYLWTVEFSSETEQRKLQNDQRRWIIDVRDKCGVSVACLNDVYVKRFNYLEEQYPLQLAKNREVLEQLNRRSVVTSGQAREHLQNCSESTPAKLRCITIFLSVAEMKLELLAATKQVSLATCQPGLKELQSLWKAQQSKRCEKELEESNLGGTSASIVFDGCNVDAAVEQINRLRSLSKCSDISSAMYQADR